MLFFRLLAGLGLGYALTRSFFGFAGGVNRSYKIGSTKLMRMLMILFVGTAIVSVCFFIGQDPTEYDLWVNPASNLKNSIELPRLILPIIIIAASNINPIIYSVYFFNLIPPINLLINKLFYF